MGHFDYTRPGGIWSGSNVVTTAELEDLDSKTERAINGDEGGTWAPSAVITIGGSGLEVSGDFEANGNSILTSCQGITMAAGSSIDVPATATIDVVGDINIDSAGNLNVLSGGEIEVRSGGLFEMLAGSSGEIMGDVDFESGSTCEFKSGSGLSTAAGATVAFASDVTMLGKLTKSGTSARTVLRSTTVTNLNSTPDVSNDIWFITINDGNTYTATLDITTPAPSTGEMVIVRKLGTSGQLNISSEGPIAICSIGPGEAGCATLVFDGTQWRLVSFWQSSDPANIFSGA